MPRLQGLKMVGLGDGVEVYIKELPVSYAKAHQLVSHIWETVSPKVTMLVFANFHERSLRLDIIIVHYI